MMPFLLLIILLPISPYLGIIVLICNILIYFHNIFLEYIRNPILNILSNHPEETTKLFFGILNGFLFAYLFDIPYKFSFGISIIGSFLIWIGHAKYIITRIKDFFGQLIN